MTYFWIITLAIATALMFFLVPFDKIRRFNLFGIVSGFVIGLITLYALATVLNYWNFSPGPLTYAGIPIALAATWWPLEIIYAHYILNGETNNFKSYLLILSLPILSTIFHGVAIALNLLTYNNWSYLGTFLYSVVIQSVIYLYLKSKVEQPAR